MTEKAKAKRPPFNASEKLALSINEFCALHSISRASFYNMRNAGEGPCEIHIGRRALISAEAAAAWRKAREGKRSAGRPRAA